MTRNGESLREALPMLSRPLRSKEQNVENEQSKHREAQATCMISGFSTGFYLRLSIPQHAPLFNLSGIRGSATSAHDIRCPESHRLS